MQLILQVFDALRTFDRPATRAELERESGLDKDAVWSGLRGLIRRGLVICAQEGRQRGMYMLTRMAERPECARGKYERDSDHRQRMALATKATRVSAKERWHADYSPARPPSHSAQPGALRVVVKGVLDVRRHQPSTFGRCVLADTWKKPRQRP